MKIIRKKRVKEEEQKSVTQNSNSKNHKEIFQKPRIIQIIGPAKNFIESGIQPYAKKEGMVKN